MALHVRCFMCLAGAGAMSTGSKDALTPEDMQPLVAPGAEISEKAAGAVGKLIEQTMAALTPMLQHKLDDIVSVQRSQHTASSAQTAGVNGGRQGLVSLEFNPIFDVSMHTDMSNAFYENNGATTTNGSVVRTNGVQLNANFSNSLHDNNNAISNGNTTRQNGYLSSLDEGSTATLKAALQTASMLGNLMPEEKSTYSSPAPMKAPMYQTHSPMYQTRSDVPALAGTLHVPDTLHVPETQSDAGSLITIKVNPKVKVAVTTNMSGSFHGNNVATANNGDATRVNGAFVDADFSGALHGNNNAISNGTSQNSASRFNGLAKSEPGVESVAH